MLREGDRKTLNIYFLEDLEGSDGKQVLGLARLPSGLQAADGLGKHGCLVYADTLPGGRFWNKSSRKTTIHEVGHWFGLLYTFDNGYSDMSDGVADTPAVRSANFDCKPGDSCPDQPGGIFARGVVKPLPSKWWSRICAADARRSRWTLMTTKRWMEEGDDHGRE